VFEHQKLPTKPKLIGQFDIATAFVGLISKYVASSHLKILYTHIFRFASTYLIYFNDCAVAFALWLIVLFSLLTPHYFTAFKNAAQCKHKTHIDMFFYFIMFWSVSCGESVEPNKTPNK
jgi:hypothetical protein